MTWKKMVMGGRQWRRHFQRAIRGSWVRALAELITNADDSYTRLGKRVEGDITVDFDRGREGGWFWVTDQAEGMTADRLAEVFEVYGGEVAAGDTRGFFNRGAKDALLAMEEGYEESIKDGEYARVDLRLGDDEQPELQITGPLKATKKRRADMEVEENGTVAHFVLPSDARVPQRESVRQALATFWMLRKIVDPENKKRRLILRYRGEEEEITYPPPAGETIIDQEVLTLEVEGYKDFEVELTLKKAEQDLEQTPNSHQRVGGLLIVDEGDAVLDLTLGRFDRDPAGGPFFGEVKIRKGFKRFLRSEEKRGRHVLSEERNGFEATHPWVQALFRLIEKEIEPAIDKEKKARSAGAQELTEAEKEHNRKIIEELNRIAEEETRKAWEGPEDDGGETLPPAAGLEIRPQQILITENRSRSVAIVADIDKVPRGEVIYIEDESDVLQIEPDEIKVEQEEGDSRVFIRWVRVSGGTAGQRGKLVAISDPAVAEASYEVVEEAYPYFESDMAFVPDPVSVVDQKVSHLNLYVKTNVVGPGESITISSSNPDHVAALDSDVLVDDSTIRGGIAKARVRVRGQGVGRRATITAERQGVDPATVEVRVRSKASPPTSKKGLFRKIEFSTQESEFERFHFEDSTGDIIIHLMEPTVSQHLGVTAEYKHLLDAQTLVAELVTQCVAQEVARRSVESGVRPYFDTSPEGMLTEDLASIKELTHRHGARIHKLVVDQQALKQARQQAQQSGNLA